MPLPRLSKRDFDRFRELISERCGLRVADTKQLLLKNRIGKRLRALGFTSFREYYDYITTETGGLAELDAFWSVVTTHQTHFFREPHHFDSLSSTVLPALASRRADSRTIRVWSAGCSTGQEPYTLAAVLLDHFKRSTEPWTVDICGTDIDNEGLEVARVGRYPAALKKEIPPRYFLRFFRMAGEFIEVGSALRGCVKFRKQNLRRLNAWYGKFDIIFCRNVVMYFQKEFRHELAAYFSSRLRDDGYLFLGSSESLHGGPRIFEPFKAGKTLIYRKSDILPATKSRREKSQ